MRKFNSGIILFLALFTLGLPGGAQERSYYFLDQVNKVSRDSIMENLEKFEQLGIKEPGTSGLHNTLNWLSNKYRSFGYKINYDSFTHDGDSLINLVVNKTGNTKSGEYLIVSAHYDTRAGPGVNDNGSGVVAILEAARILMEIDTRYSVKFIHFSAEESGYLGSYHYVDKIGKEKLPVRLVLNIDEVGSVAGSGNLEIICERNPTDPVSIAFTDSLKKLTGIYTSLKGKSGKVYNSDYVPFLKNGYPVTGLFEANQSTYVHSIDDSLSHVDVDYVTEVARLTVAATLFFSRAFDPSATVPVDTQDRGLQVIHRSGGNFLEVKGTIPAGTPAYMIIYGLSGKVMKQTLLKPGNEHKITFQEFHPGIYLYSLITGSGRQVTGKFIKE